MPVTDVVSNAEALTLTIVAEYPVPVTRLWEAYMDPRQLERFWGPREWPATFTRHDMYVDGESHYYMTGPDGTVSGGKFRILAMEPYVFFEAHDAFADEHGHENIAMPTMRMRFDFEATVTGSRFTSTTWFTTAESMEQLLNMGMVEGTKSAMSQIDDVLADLRTFATDMPATAQLLNDTTVRVSRVIRGTPAQVWRAHHEPSLIQQWLLGPDGWRMPVCEVADMVGHQYRYEWTADDGSQRFGFEGTLLESVPPVRSVTTEQMIGTDGPATRNELTLTPVPGGTLLSIVITYPNKESRDMILGTGMTTGMEASYARLEQLVCPVT